MAGRVRSELRHHHVQPMLYGGPHGFVIVEADNLSLRVQVKAHLHPDERCQGGAKGGCGGIGRIAVERAQNRV